MHKLKVTTSKAWFIHRISARNLKSELAAAFLLHIGLVLLHYTTEMQHQFKCQISAVVYMY